MIFRKIDDWDDAYTHTVNIPRGERWPDAWIGLARAFRDRLSTAGRAELDVVYGPKPRNQLDLFWPDSTPRGLVVFIHGGYWKEFNNRFWSHLAGGAVCRGYAVAMPTYTLCPEVRVADIVAEIAAAIAKAASMVDGDIVLSGHSAGGHLATRMVCAASPFRRELQARVRHVVSISGVHDLRPLLYSQLNDVLGIDEAEAGSESPVLLRPMNGARVTCWVGSSERSEFIRQNSLLANIWTGLGAATRAVEEPDKHHFNVIDGLADPDHPLSAALFC